MKNRISHFSDTVVALESTLITHGLAYPTNLEVARAMEGAVREEGAVPATIAILGGQITVGLADDELEYLGTRPRQAVRKCSRRDLPIAVGRGEDAATTVAGTMVVAHKAGIEVLATGGIGGVHRGHPFDVSADLIELGRTPVTVVCSGAKSILDLPLTLEVLETQGVPVVGYGTDTLPAFYSRSSGLPVDVRVEGAEDVATIVRARRALGLTHATLVTVPVPAEEALSREEAEAAIGRPSARRTQRASLARPSHPLSWPRSSSSPLATASEPTWPCWSTTPASRPALPVRWLSLRIEKH